MRRVHFEVDGERYRIELHDDVLIMSHHRVDGWDEVARLTVAAATLLASLNADGPDIAPARGGPGPAVRDLPAWRPTAQ